MQIRLLSPPQDHPLEKDILAELFALGLSCFHLRKPEYTRSQYEAYIRGVAEIHRKKIIIHQHEDLAVAYGLGGIHLTESHRKSLSSLALNSLIERVQQRGQQIGTSVHEVADIYTLPQTMDYTFVSPLFESISKQGYKPRFIWDTRQLEPIPSVLLVGLGGVNVHRLDACKARGFESVAMLGNIWLAPSPVAAWKELITE